METLDWIIVSAYFVLLIGIVRWSSRRTSSAADYFLAGREIGWFVVGCSLLASNIGSEHIVGLAGNGATSGMAMAHWELHAWVMLMLGWVFIPFYYRSNVFTMPEFLEKRFDSRTRWALSIVSLVAYVFTKVSVTVYAGAIVFQALLPDTFGTPENAFWIGAFTTVILTGIYTIFGGLRAVVYTEVAQTVLLLAGSAFITFFALAKLGGWGELKAILAEEPARFALWRPLSDPDFPWLGVMIASPVIGIWYWCTDQYIVQRCLAARNLTEARRGAIFGGFLKVLPVFIFLVPGLIGYALHKKGIMLLPVENGDVKGDAVFPTMVSTLLPAGLRGIVVAGLVSALMSSLASLFNSCATLFTVDIYAKMRPNRPDKELVKVGRIATAVVVLLGILWIPTMKTLAQGGLYQYLQAVQGYLAPPITAVFLLGLFSSRINARGAFVGLVLGFVLGLMKLAAQAMIGPDSQVTGLVADFARMNFLYYSGVLLVVSIIIVILASLTAPAPDAKQLVGLTYGSVTAEQKAELRASWNWVDVVTSFGVLALVIGIYLYFSFWLT